jgi:hypothetical protein
LLSDLYPRIKTALNYQGSNNPLYISAPLAGIALRLKSMLGSFSGGINFEQPWMLKYTDRPWIIDNDYTRNKLDWSTNPDLDILERLPVILRFYKEQKNQWISRNEERISGKYVYKYNRD